MGNKQWKAPAFRLTSARQGAVSYRFSVAPREGDGGAATFGWAICTVNDDTGELQIMSDWGNWAYRWNTSPSNLGQKNLTAFIGARSTTWTDTDGTVYYDGYIADKLCGKTDGSEFDDQATADAMCAVIAKRRLEDGRASRVERHYDPARGIYNQRRLLDSGTARDLSDDLQRLVGSIGGRSEATAELFLERIFAVLKEHDAASYELLAEPWDLLQYRPTFSYRVLREGILPALIEACAITATGVRNTDPDPTVAS